MIFKCNFLSSQNVRKTGNVGILTSINWNSKHWADRASDKDIQNSKYDYVIENGRAHEDLNFGHEKFPTEEDGYYIAYTPMFNRMPSKIESKYVDVVFFRSLNHKNKKNYIIGFYAFPIIDNVERKAEHKYFNEFTGGNLKALPKNIVLFENPIEISDEIAQRQKFLPVGKLLGQQGFNYLTIENVLKILDTASLLNPKDSKLKSIKFKFVSDNKYTLR